MIGSVMRWFFVDGWPAWVAAAPIVCVLVYTRVGLSPETFEARLRIGGFALQLLGLATIALGLSHARKLFGRPSVVQRAGAWWAKRPWIPPPHSFGSGAARAGGGAKLRSEAHTDLLPNPTIEERVVALERNVSGLRDRVIYLDGQIVKNAEQVRAQIEQEQAARESSHKQLRDKLEEFSVGGLLLEITGLVWIVTGLVIATASFEIENAWPTDVRRHALLDAAAISRCSVTAPFIAANRRIRAHQVMYRRRNSSTRKRSS